ncbi:ComEA family DNA-binding protein [Chryseolinea lacunae]|uniref:Helix-hairpin-helix domain-containing protein n=1 Tax=Chryseolinea lacunae TaxID=2801331 RepID=A0ABS1KLG2_9BACT|nr:helix-hairpin-helix domain-containing protein [Chryseolinea lacunae]MBL0740281.1 helix-hairpin-helix domain-containing protein [Chryseolinea lacunae]
MNRIQRYVRDFFGFSRAQVNGFLVLLPLLVIILFAPTVWKAWRLPRPYDNTKDQAKLDSLVAFWVAAQQNDSVVATGGAKSKKQTLLFAFDPNIISVAQWQQLGLSAALSTRIAHYREKGGKFRVKADLLKIYGVDSAFYHRVFSYITLPEKKDTLFAHKPFPADVRKKPEVVRFDLNQADAEQLESLYGIGEKLALRILKFRDALGGFVSLQQLSEVYGLDTAAIRQLEKRCFVVENFQPKKLNVNTADEKTLAAHPLIRRTAARIIVAYRKEHGEFNSPDDLRKIHGLDVQIIDKIAPYLTFRN